MSTAVDSMQRFWSFWCLTRAHRGKREKKKKANELRMRNGKLCNIICRGEESRENEKIALKKVQIYSTITHFLFTFEPVLIATTSSPSSLFLFTPVRRYYVGSIW